MAREDPWAAIGDPVEDAVAFGNPSQQLAPDATPTPAAIAPASDAFAGVAEPVDPAQLTDSTQTIEGFADELPDQSASDREMPEDVRAETVRILSENPLGTAADDARRYLASKGWDAATDNFEKVIAFRAKNNTVDKNFQVVKPKPLEEETVPGAVARGVADVPTMGFADELSGLADATKKAVTGTQSELGFWHDVNIADDIYSGRVDRDEEEHPLARISGQLLGGLAIPITYEGVGLRAGTVAMKEAKAAGNITAQEALKIGRKAAARAVTKQMARDGAVVGGLHGIGTGEGAEGRVEQGLIEAGLGGAGGAVTGLAGEVVAPRIVAGRATARALPAEADMPALAERLQIDPTPATVGGKTSELVQRGAGNIPGANVAVSQGVARETGDLEAAARRVAESAGTPATRQAAGEGIARGATAYKKLTKMEAERLYGARDAAFGGSDAPVVLNEFDRAVQKLRDQFPGSPAIAQLHEHPVIRRVEGALEGSPQREATLAEATETLSHVRGVLRNLAAKSETTPVVISRVKKIEQALEDDVMSAARSADQASGRAADDLASAVTAQKNADAYYAQRARALNGALKQPLNSAGDPVKFSGEAVYNRLVADMGRKGGNLARLRETWFRLPTASKRTFAATAIDDLGRALPGQQNVAGDAWSFNTFLTNYDNMAPQARHMVFGSDVDSHLRDIAAYSSRLRDIYKSRNFSNTVPNYFAGALGLTIIHALMGGDAGAAVEAAAAVPAAWASAKLFLATPAMREWTRSALKVAQGSNPKTATTAARTLTARLGTIAKAEPAIASDILSLQQRLTEAFANPTMQAAAEDDTTDKPQTP